RAMTYLHLDEMNKVSDICLIVNTSDFDFKQGNHLILSQLGILIEFLPDSIILISSATLVHSNIAIQDYEQRESMTLYTTGELFWWINYNFQIKKD
ncbi:hypothetical protein BDY19DRAFT_871449, partial [Irpex rosettiformis]